MATVVCTSSPEVESVHPPSESGLALCLLLPVERGGTDVCDLEPRPQDSMHLLL